MVIRFLFPYLHVDDDLFHREHPQPLPERDVYLDTVVDVQPPRFWLLLWPFPSHKNSRLSVFAFLDTLQLFLEVFNFNYSAVKYFYPIEDLGAFPFPLSPSSSVRVCVITFSRYLSRSNWSIL